MLAVVKGDRSALEDIVVQLARSHSFKKRKQGVTDAFCIFEDPVRLARLLSINTSRSERKAIRDSLSPHQLMVAIEESGISQKGMRIFRTLLKGIFHCEDSCLTESNKEREATEAKLGKPIKIVDTGWFLDAKCGYMYDAKRYFITLAERALQAHKQPEDSNLDFTTIEKDCKKEIRAKLGATKSEFQKVKLEAGLRNVEKKVRAGKRRLQFDGCNDTIAKERTTGPLVHRQMDLGLDEIESNCIFN